MTAADTLAMFAGLLALLLVEMVQAQVIRNRNIEG